MPWWYIIHSARKWFVMPCPWGTAMFFSHRAGSNSHLKETDTLPLVEFFYENPNQRCVALSVGYFFFFLANSSILKVGSLPVKVLRLLVSPMSIVLFRAIEMSHLFALDFESKLPWFMTYLQRNTQTKPVATSYYRGTKIEQLRAICTTTASWYIHRLRSPCSIPFVVATTSILHIWIYHWE